MGSESRYLIVVRVEMLTCKLLNWQKRRASSWMGRFIAANMDFVPNFPL